MSTLSATCGSPILSPELTSLLSRWKVRGKLACRLRQASDDSLGFEPVRGNIPLACYVGVSEDRPRMLRRL